MAAEVDGTWVAAPQCPRRRLNGRQVLACPSGEAACLLAVDTCLHDSNLIIVPILSAS